MKVAILSEFPADEAAVQILAAAVLDQPVELVEPHFRRAWGFPAALNILATALKWLHYQRPAEALIVVVDSNDSPLHEGPFDEPCPNAAKCRLCKARALLAETRHGLKDVPYEPIKTAVGLAVPAIEAWYLCGKDTNVSENAWVQAMREHRRPYTRRVLKERVYGTSRPNRALETRCATDEMTRVVQDLGRLERQFPVGFGSLLHDLRQW